MLVGVGVVVAVGVLERVNVIDGVTVTDGLGLGAGMVLVLEAVGVIVDVPVAVELGEGSGDSSTPAGSVPAGGCEGEASSVSVTPSSSKANKPKIPKAKVHMQQTVETTPRPMAKYNQVRLGFVSLIRTSSISPFTFASSDGEFFVAPVDPDMIHDPLLLAALIGCKLPGRDQLHHIAA